MLRPKDGAIGIKNNKKKKKKKKEKKEKKREYKLPLCWDFIMASTYTKNNKRKEGELKLHVCQYLGMVPGCTQKQPKTKGKPNCVKT